MLNVTAYGRIASDIIVKRSRNGEHLYTSFLLASHRRKETTFIRCVAFDAMATLLHDFFSKGDRIFIKGDLIDDNYNGSKFVFKIKVQSFEFIETIKEHNKNKKRHSSKENDNETKGV